MSGKKVQVNFGRHCTTASVSNSGQERSFRGSGGELVRRPWFYYGLRMEYRVEQGEAVPCDLCGRQEIMFNVWEWPLGT